MKKSVLILCALALAGAGCYQAPASPAQAPAVPTVAVGEQNPSPASETLKVDMEIGNFFFAPATITAKAGQKVDVTFTKNEGFHTFVIDGVAKLPIAVGTTKSFTAPSAPGSYPFYCDVNAHRSKGMEGTLIVK